MKPGYLNKTFLGLVAGLTLLAALLSPVPVHAGTPVGASPHEPPPPQTPANDLGSGGKKGSPVQSGVPAGESSSTSSAAADAPNAAGTPLLLASQLSIGALAPVSANLVLPNQVKFCPQSGPDFFNADCQERTTLEDIITYIKGLDDASGVIYVDQNYSTGATLPQPGLVFDQNTFKNAGPSLATGLDMYGGYDYSLGTATTTKTVLNQPVTIQNFNASSHFSLDMFQFNITGYAAGDPAAAAVNVSKSNHVTLTDLDINESSTGSGVVATQSNDLTLQRILLADSDGGRGVDISQTSTILLDQVNSTSTSTTGYGAYLNGNSNALTITNSQFDGSTNAGVSVLKHSGDITLDGVNASNNGVFGAAFLSDSGGLTIRNSQFNNNKNTGLEAFAQIGAINLDTVTVTSNRSNGGLFISHNGLFSISNSQFNNNGASGLILFANSGPVDLDGVTASSNTASGASIGQNGGDVQISSGFFNRNGIGGLDLEYNFNPLAPGSETPASFTVTLDQVQALANADYGALVGAGGNDSYPAVDVFITNSNFDQNRGKHDSGLTINTFGSVHMENVSASGNAANGAAIVSLGLFINNSRFNSNRGYGLALAQAGNSALVNVRACFNHLGPVDLLSGTPFLQNLDTTCPAPDQANLAPAAPVETGLPWQTIVVFSDVNQGMGRLSCQMGTTFVYLQKGSPPAADHELARVELPPCIVPEGSMASFQGLAQAGLPAPLPNGAAFQGPAFELAISRPGGGLANPGGALALHFNLPGGFSLPAGKKLAALWFDPAAKQWVVVPTFTGPNAAFAFSVKMGAFVLVVK